MSWLTFRTTGEYHFKKYFSNILQFNIIRSHKTKRRRRFSTGGVGRWSLPQDEELQSSAAFPTDLPSI